MFDEQKWIEDNRCKELKAGQVVVDFCDGPRMVVERIEYTDEEGPWWVVRDDRGNTELTRPRGVMLSSNQKWY